MAVAGSTPTILACAFVPMGSCAGAMRFCEVLKIRVLNHVFRGAIAAK
ncbi:hypothetical protein COO91_08473 [Nostoc flagelliforme CCNUN1]|uniref:Uncharacterized protein n=1 Tax=Nostoc flagelliforme CCNUN1 TaxID=2038116 RepID=A0A2K8T405_9NOSO|nr:hypothetical protein COO91_08473 [Nostoc flagelliforme CCNUN1]